MKQYYFPSVRTAIILLCTALFLAAPVHAFTANSLDITVDKNGDATAVFRFTLEGLIENAIPQSMLEEQLVNGLGSSSEPPTLVSMDRSQATLILKKFASTYDVPQGTDYQTSTMDFKKAEIALQNSAVSSVITADFSPSKVTLAFPDGYTRTFTDADSLPSITHTVVDPAKAALVTATTAVQGGTLNVTATPADTEILVDGTNMGNAPIVLTGIPAGSHTLTFQKAGYTPVTRIVNVTDGKTIRLTIYLAAEEPVPTQASPGYLAGTAVIAAGLVLLAYRRK